MITRVTQRMLTQRSLSDVNGGLARMAAVQQQMATGKKINVPSDDPAGTTTAMRIRSSLADQNQYTRNAQDGLAWLTTVDSTLQGITSQVQRAKTLALQGANTGSMSQTSLDAIAAEIQQIRGSVLQQANTTYLGRPVFGGTTSGGVAYDSTGTYVGDSGVVNRRVGNGVQVQVNQDATSTFGADGSNLFNHLDALYTALTTGNQAGITQGITDMSTDLDRLSGAAASEGARMNRINQASTMAANAQLSLKSSLSDVEDVDLAQATIDLQTQQTAYQAALAATSKTIQPSLLDFLR
jgi:flagellar hook-associated protein 3 FlgL